MKIFELFKVPRVEGAYAGLELEMEGQHLPGVYKSVPPNSKWKAVADGSLRDGIELVFKQPLSALDVKSALGEVEQMFKDNQTVPEYSFRTSSHVHLNFSNLEVEVAKVFLLMFLIFENELVGFCAPGRVGNRFCLRTLDAYNLVQQYNAFLESNRIPAENEAKYSAINLCTLSKYGTIEIRCLEGTSDWARIHQWSRILLGIRRTAKEINTRANLMENMNLQDLANRIFSTERAKKAFLKTGWEDRAQLQLSYLAELFEV